MHFCEERRPAGSLRYLLEPWKPSVSSIPGWGVTTRLDALQASLPKSGGAEDDLAAVAHISLLITWIMLAVLQRIPNFPQ